jgi:hypothetical protein
VTIASSFRTSSSVSASGLRFDSFWKIVVAVLPKLDAFSVKRSARRPGYRAPPARASALARRILIRGIGRRLSRLLKERTPVAQPCIAFAIVAKGFKDGADSQAGLGVAMFHRGVARLGSARGLLYDALPPLTTLARRRTVSPREPPPCAAALAHRTLISGRASLLLCQRCDRCSGCDYTAYFRRCVPARMKTIPTRRTPRKVRVAMKISTVLSPALASAALALLTGCSGGSSTTASLPTTGGLTQMQQTRVETLLHPEMTGIAPKFRGLVHPSSAGRCRFCVDDLFVTDGGLGDVEILENGSYTDDGTISLGLNSVEGDFVDKQGNLYVADNAAHRIQEYKPGGSAPSFTYSAGMDQPVQVSVDSHGNVYEADYSTRYYGGGWINEYKQGTNVVEHTCTFPSPVAGVAVDSSGDVFMSANGPGFIAFSDFNNGLSGCQSSVYLQIPGFSGGMVIDAKRNLIVGDQTGKIDVIYPPYSQVNYTIPGFSHPFGLALAQDNKTLYVADWGTKTVKVLKYPSAVLITTLGSGNGLSVPFGVTDYPNAVY